MFFDGEQENDGWLVPRVLLDLPKLNSFKYKRGSVKLYSRSDRIKAQLVSHDTFCPNQNTSERRS